MNVSEPALTVAVVNHHLRGYPLDCLIAAGACEPPDDVEYLLVQGDVARSCDDVRARLPRVRVLSLTEGDRAAAKNLALGEARGRTILLLTSDVMLRAGARDRLREYVESLPAPALVSAQLLQENGMRRRTRYGFPSVLHEVHPFAWLFRRYHRMWHKGRPPMSGVVVEAPALHAVCLAATRETFARIGAFESGYRFGHEDVAYSWRAEKADIPRRILLDAHAFKIAPQLYGELPLAVRYGMERSLYRLVRATRGTVYAAGFVLIRRAKSLVKWMIASVLNLLIFRCSRLLDLEERFHRAVLFMPWHDGETLVIPPDIESHVRWEDFA